MKMILIVVSQFIFLLSINAAEIPSNCQKSAELACAKAIVSEDCVNRMISACHRITMVPATDDPAYKRAVELSRLLCKNDDFILQIECLEKTYPEVAKDLLI